MTFSVTRCILIATIFVATANGPTSSEKGTRMHNTMDQFVPQGGRNDQNLLKCKAEEARSIILAVEDGEPELLQRYAETRNLTDVNETNQKRHELISQIFEKFGPAESGFGNQSELAYFLNNATK